MSVLRGTWERMACPLQVRCFYNGREWLELPALSVSLPIYFRARFVRREQILEHVSNWALK